MVVSGRVQGVFFRAHTRELALEREVAGWVRNLADGRVEAVFEGEKKDIDEMIDWCRNGPKNALVEKVEVKWETPGEIFPIFKIVS